MSGLISVIVPVYNAAPYLRPCIESVLCQTYPDFELILTDDGSTDQSAEICREFCRKDPRIRFYSREHGGVSAARNASIEQARGSFLFFLDCDDAIHPALLQTLLSLSESCRAEVAVSGYRRISSALFSQETAAVFREERKVSFFSVENSEALGEFSCEQFGQGLFSAIGGKLIQREILGTVRFDEQLVNGEDTKFLYQLFSFGAAAVLLENDWYYYRIHSESASRKRGPEFYRSIYCCRKFIVRGEAEHGRKDSAGLIEQTLLYDLLDWYRASRRGKNNSLRCALEEIAFEERKSEEFQSLSLIDRLRFVLAFSFYPVYRAIRWLLTFFRKRKEGEARFL